MLHFCGSKFLVRYSKFPFRLQSGPFHGPATESLQLCPDCCPHVTLWAMSNQKGQIPHQRRAEGPIDTSLGHRPRSEAQRFLIRAESPPHLLCDGSGLQPSTLSQTSLSWGVARACPGWYGTAPSALHKRGGHTHSVKCVP